MLTASNDGLITVFKSVVVHPLAEVTVTVQEPGASPDKSSDEAPFDQEKVYGVKPPFAVKFIEPLALPKQSGFVITALSVGELVTTTDNVVVVAQTPTVGVKVQVPEMVLLIVAGNQLPVIPFVDVVGKVGATDPEQIGPIELNNGTIGPFTVNVELAVAVQPQEFVTVSVYVVVEVGQATGFKILVADKPVVGVQA